VSTSSQGGGGKTGLDVWDGALLLTDHLLTSGSLEGQRVVELGAGTGVHPPSSPSLPLLLRRVRRALVPFSLSHVPSKASCV